MASDKPITVGFKLEIDINDFPPDIQAVIIDKLKLKTIVTETSTTNVK